MIPTKIDRMRERAARNLPAPDPSDLLRQYGLVFAEAGKNLGDNIRKLGESLQLGPAKITFGHPAGPRIHDETHDEPDGLLLWAEWQSWDLITAGDGRHFGNEHDGTWVDLDHSGRRWTHAEIAELGPVRQAVIVTLPDEWAEVTIDADGLIEIHKTSTSRPWKAREIAAELLAAAITTDARS